LPQAEFASNPVIWYLISAGKMADWDQSFPYKGRLYVPCNSARLAAGPFLGASLNSVERHVELPPGFLLDRHRGIRPDRAGLAAAWVHGDSMIDRDILDGALAIFQRSDFDTVKHNRVLVIEKIGDEEGLGLEKTRDQAASVIPSK
jgi:hypothetical protein